MNTTNTTPIAQEFVRDTHVEAMEARIAKMNKQAAKLGVAPIVAVRTGQEEERVTGHMVDAAGRKFTFRHNFIEFAVYGEQPKLPGGWSLLAVIDHREELPIVNTVPGIPVSPVGQRDRGPICDHCNAIRRRSDTFVLLAEDGRLVQVGRQCLADFLGMASNDPTSALMFFMGIGDVLGFDNEDMEPGGFRAYGANWRLDIVDVVRISGAVTDVNGFVSRSRSEQVGQEATSSRVMDFIDPPRFSGRDAERARAKFRAWVAKVEEKMTPALDEEVTAAIAWAASQTGDSEFIQNVATLAQLKSVSRKYLGTVVWIMAGYRKAQDKLREAEAKAKVFGKSEHVGEVAKRMEADLKLIDVRPIDGDYGTTYITTFVDGDGNKVKWFASNDPQSEYSAFEGGWELDQVRHVKMTPKKHDSYNGVLETVVNRVAPFTPKAKKAKAKKA